MRLSVPLLACAILAASLPAQNPEKIDVEALREQAQEAVASSQWEDAIAAYRKITTADAADASAWHMLGYSLHAAGKLDEALEVHLKAAKFAEVAPTATYNVACVYALKGDKERAFEWLRKAIEAGFNRAEHLDGDSDLDSLRDDPRYQEIVKAMKATRPAAGLQVFAGTSPRQSSRVLLWQGDRSPGQVVIDHGTPPWKDSYSKMLDKPDGVGRRWRLGKDFWTTLDSNLELEIGGVKVPAGYYYLTLEHQGERKFVLALNDPALVRAKTLDAFQADQTEGGIEIPLQYAETEDAAKELEIKLKVKARERKGAVVVRFGPHQLTAEVLLPAATGPK